ncbi:BamA/TamA family outer membrane protein [candidate division WOR-3 bacterium]|nr:BamA/TamA family outer membrane protein [candidate division WOR-3 bacterium]
MRLIKKFKIRYRVTLRGKSSVIKTALFSLMLIYLLYGCASQLRQNGESKVLKINFEGNYFISDKKLRAVLPVKEGDQYIEQFLRESPNRIVSYYRSRGFFDMRVIKREGEFLEEKNGFVINYHIFEGVRSKVDSVEIIGNKIFTNDYIKAKLSVEKESYYDEASIDAGKYILSKNYAEKGFADASITIERSFLNGGGDKNRVYLKIIINEGNKIYVRKVEIKGLKEVRSKVVRREFRMKKGDVYQPSKVYLSQTNLYRTEMFSDVNVHEEKVHGDSVDITFILKEEKSRFFQVGLGYESPRMAIFDFRWGDLDLFGNLQRLIVDLSFKGTPEFQENDGGLIFKDWEQNYRLTYREPYLLGTAFNLITSPSLKRRKSESDFSFEFVLEREIGPFSVISFPYEYRRASIKADTISITNKVSGRFLFDKRNNILNPSKGLRLILQFDYAGGVLGGDNHFDRVNIDFASYYPLPLRLIIAQRSRAVVTFPRGAPEDISPDVRLEMGGYGSLRGYKEASIGYPDTRPDRLSGLDELLFNFELRMPVYGRWYATIFADFGSLWMDQSDISLEDFKTGVGFGIGYNAPIGVIRLDYARAMEETYPENRGKIYLNFGHPF